MSERVPLCKPGFGKEELKRIGEVLESGWLAHGPRVKEFEEKFAGYIGAKYAVSLNSCASALQAAIMAKSLKGEIILPSFTFPASANAIVNAGCVPVFADIEKDTMNISPEDIMKKINHNTVGIMPVHFAGLSCKMDKIMEIATNHDLTVIEDSAEAIGSTYQSKKTGSFDIGCFSFYPTKNITTGEGGMITTNDEKIAENARTIRGHGVKKGAFEREKLDKPWIRVSVMPGYNFRMNEISAVLGLTQLKKLDRFNEKRRENAKYLSKGLSRYKQITVPSEPEDAYHVYQMYVIQVSESVDRDNFVIFLRNNNVEASVHFEPPVHLHPYYMNEYKCREGDLPITENVAKRVVTLPMFPSMTKKQMDKIIVTICKALEKCKQ
ncbi:DegT/DnrJ/EryC1/StrS family aminotransferase [Candidatus Woesearchaeota archaeon]|nr:DegT/DnrJ/EryC1/StrS family aminotransferase [Candidatus Woesearchaeota archaeon]